MLGVTVALKPLWISSVLYFDGATYRAVGVTFGLGAAITPAVAGRAGLAAATELYLGRLFAAGLVAVAKALDGDGLRYFYD